MCEPQDAVEHVRERFRGGVGTVRIAETQLRELDVDIGELAPHELLERGRVFAEVVGLDEPREVRDHGLRARKDPPLGGTERGIVLGAAVRGPAGLRVRLERAEHEAADIPELVRELPRVLQLAFGELAIRARGHAVHEREAQRVGAHLLDHADGALDIALRLRHLLGASVRAGNAHEAVEIHGREGHVAHVLDAHHDHAGDPEKDDVVARLEHRAGIEACEVGRLLGPSKGAVWPQR